MKNEFGPNQDEVDQLLERLEKVDQSQALFLASFGDGDPAATVRGSPCARLLAPRGR